MPDEVRAPWMAHLPSRHSKVTKGHTSGSTWRLVSETLLSTAFNHCGWVS